MEMKPHALIHTMLGGIGGECDTKWDMLHADGLISHGSLTSLKHACFAILKNIWRAKLIEMPTGCSTDAPVHDCMWKCANITAIADEASGLISGWYDNPHWEEVTKVAFCETAFWPGDHLEAASAVEPSFWMIHPTLERLLQYKDLAQPFTDKTWIAQDNQTSSQSLCQSPLTGCEVSAGYTRS
jgi:hypothetical protein